MCLFLTLSVEGPLWPVVLMQVYPLLLAQLADFTVELSGNVDIRCWDRPSDTFRPKEAIDLWGGGEDPIVCSGAQDQPHIRPCQVKIPRC